jgi:hypothetical protein
VGSNDIEFSGEKEGAWRLTPRAFPRGVPSGSEAALPVRSARLLGRRAVLLLRVFFLPLRPNDGNRLHFDHEFRLHEANHLREAVRRRVLQKIAVATSSVPVGREDRLRVGR